MRPPVPLSCLGVGSQAWLSSTSIRPWNEAIFCLSVEMSRGRKGLLLTSWELRRQKTNISAQWCSLTGHTHQKLLKWYYWEAAHLSHTHTHSRNIMVCWAVRHLTGKSQEVSCMRIFITIHTCKRIFYFPSSEIWPKTYHFSIRLTACRLGSFPSGKTVQRNFLTSSAA